MSKHLLYLLNSTNKTVKNRKIKHSNAGKSDAKPGL